MGKLTNSETYSPLDLDTTSLSLLVNQLANESGVLAEEISDDYNLYLRNLQGSKPSFLDEDIWAKLDRAQRYGRLAKELAYVCDTRLPLLPAASYFTLELEEEYRDNFVHLIKGKKYSLDYITCAQELCGQITKATDKLIPKAQIKKAARLYLHMHQNTLLSTAVDDVLHKQETVDILKKSVTGTYALEQATKLGCTHYFIDLHPWNFVRRDANRGNAVGCYFPDNRIYMDVCNKNPGIHLAIKLAHECAHAIQFREHLNIERYQTPASLTGVLSNIRQYDSTLEAHSIGMEYGVGADLLHAGYDPFTICNALYRLAPDVVNLLIERPAEFILAVSQHERVADLWQMTKKQTKPSPKLAREFAKSLKSLTQEWGEHEKLVIDYMERRVNNLAITSSPQLREILKRVNSTAPRCP